MNRRFFVSGLGACGAAALAGCIGSRTFRREDIPSLGAMMAPELDLQNVFDRHRFPNIEVSNDGTILAFAESGSLLRRSRDGGRSFGGIQRLNDGDIGACVVDRNTGDILVVKSEDGLLWRSRDNGETFTRENIEIKPNAYGHGTPGGVPAITACSESGVTLQHGKHKGRLLMPARIMPPFGTNEQEWWPYHYNTSIFSDDGGRTWQTSYPVQSGTGEGTLAELSSGDIYYNSRSHLSVDHRRRIAWSHDGGDMYVDWRVDNDLREVGEPFYYKYGTEPSYGCNAGLIRLPLKTTGGRDVLVFSAPDNPGKGRINMSVFASFDRGRSWPVKRQVWAGPSAYSSLAADPDGNIYLLFEKGTVGLYENLTLAKFNLAWLAEGHDLGELFGA